MLEHERNGLGVQAYVQGIEHGANHRHAKMRFQHRWNVWQHHRYGVALANTASGQRTGQAPGAFVGLLPVAADGAMNHRRVLAIDRRGAFDEAQGAQCLMIDRRGRQALRENRHEWFLCRGRLCGVLQTPGG
ncbi:hypothetical protein D3C79_771480 [compost metagenome]